MALIFIRIRLIVVAALLLINLVLYVASLVIAGWTLDVAIDQTWDVVSYNPASFFVVVFALVAGVVGVASVLSGLAQLHHRDAIVSSSSSTASALIAWLLTLLAMGVASKEISLGGLRILNLTLLEALLITLAITQFFYILALVAGGFARGKYLAKTHETQETIEIPSKETPTIEKEARTIEKETTSNETRETSETPSTSKEAGSSS